MSQQPFQPGDKIRPTEKWKSNYPECAFNNEVLTVSRCEMRNVGHGWWVYTDYNEDAIDVAWFERVPAPSPFRDKIAYILGHEIIYSTQYQSIEFGRSNEQLESLILKEMGSFAEWIGSTQFIFDEIKKTWQDWEEERDPRFDPGPFTTQQLIEHYYESIKG